MSSNHGIPCGPRLGTMILLALFPFSLFSCRSSAAEENDSRDATRRSAPLEEEVRFTNGPTRLEGTLFRPATSGERPAVVILAGSDRSRRGPLRMSIARHFADHGVVALVYDSPGTGASTGNALLQTRDERVVEALSALDHLRETKGIRSTAVGLFGGSEGADVALLASARAPRVAFVIAVSGALGVSILDVLRYSGEKKGYGLGLTPNEISRAITFKEIAFAFLSGVEIVEWSLIESRVKPWKDDTWATLIDVAKQRKETLTRLQREALLSSLRQVIERFASEPWFRSVDIGNAVQRTIDLDVDSFFGLLEAGRYARDWDRSLCDVSGIRCPVLAIWGEEDSFLPPNQGAMMLRKALADSKHPDHEIVMFPNATHFLTMPGPTMDFVPGYLDTLTDWLGRHVGRDAGP